MKPHDLVKDAVNTTKSEDLKIIEAKHLLANTQDGHAGVVKAINKWMNDHADLPKWLYRDIEVALALEGFEPLDFDMDGKGDRYKGTAGKMYRLDYDADLAADGFGVGARSTHKGLAPAQAPTPITKAEIAAEDYSDMEALKPGVHTPWEGVHHQNQPAETPRQKLERLRSAMAVKEAPKVVGHDQAWVKVDARLDEIAMRLAALSDEAKELALEAMALRSMVKEQLPLPSLFGKEGE